MILTSRQVRTSATDETSGGTSAELSVDLDRMDRVVGDLQRRAMGLRTAPLLRVLEPLPRLARDLGHQTGKRVEVVLSGAELELDRSILDRLSDPLVHLVRNAVDHGVEDTDTRRLLGKEPAGTLRIDARREKNAIRIAVTDDGKGIDLDGVLARAVDAGLVHADLAEDLPPDEVAALVFRPGLSTKEQVSDISGRGVGMDAVKATIESLGGSVELESRLGLGTTTLISVPIAAAVQRALLIGLGGQEVALPIARVERILEVSTDTIERAGNEAFTLIEDEPVVVLDLAARLGLEPMPETPITPLLLAEIRGQRVGIMVERVSGQQEIYVKPVPPLLMCARTLAGWTVLGDGRPVFVLDVNQLA